MSQTTIEDAEIEAQLDAMLEFDRTHVRLTDYGWCPTIPASEIEVGMKRAYHSCGVCPVVKVEKRGGWMHITVSSRFGEDTTRHRPETRLPIIVNRDSEPVRVEERKLDKVKEQP